MKPPARPSGIFSMRPLELATWLLPMLLLSIFAVGRHAADSAAAAPVTATSRIDLNAAPLAELTTIPGMSPRRAQALIAAREKRGAFQRVSDLAGVAGFTPGYVRRIEDLVEVK